MTDLRQRLQARRERIKSGLPPPDPITVTDNFFASRITRTNVRKCSECNVEFEPHGSQVTCSKACGEARQKRLYGGGGYALTCGECGTAFTANDPRAVVCSEECRKERRRRYMREWVSDRYYKTKPKHEPRECAAEGCGKVFTPVRAKQATCGAKKCQREHQRAKRREYYAKQRERLAEMMAEAERKQKGRAA